MIYPISDLHLDHKNIIRYCDRYFSSVEGMNRTTIDSGNRVVKEGDFAHLVGDLVDDPAFGIKIYKM